MPGYANPQSLNRFSYVNNNPLRYIDPSGHMLTVGDAGGGGSTCNIFTSNCNPSGGGGGGGGGCNTLASCSGGGSGGNGGGTTTLSSTPNPTPTPTSTPSPTPTSVPAEGGASYCITHPASCGIGSSSGSISLSLPPLPPSPFACGWFDCALSALSILASGVAGATEYGAPEIAAVAVGVDLVVTAIAFSHTVNDYHQGKISVEREWILNGTGVLGVIPIGPFGLGFSIINGMATGSGYPP